jgi:serine protease Do
LDDGTELPATLMGHDIRSDLAVIKITPVSPLSAISFGDSDNAQPGQWVIAMGNPFGLGGSVTAGIVSARGRDIGEGPYDSFIQVDAPINQGNSGGPLFTADGKVIGINTAIYSPSGGSVGIGFATPSNVLVSVLTQLEHGERVERGFIGISMQPITKDLAKAFGLKNSNGALVNELSLDGPASLAGIKSGDIITGVNGKTINTPRELAITVGGIKPDSEIKLALLREGEEKTVSVKIGILPTSPEEEKEQEIQKPSSDLGVIMGPNTNKSQGGVLVTGVREGSIADHIGIHPGDVLLGVGGKNFTSVQDAKTILAGVSGTIALHIARDSHTSFLAIELKAQETKETKPTPGAKLVPVVPTPDKSAKK